MTNILLSISLLSHLVGARSPFPPVHFQQWYEGPSWWVGDLLKPGGPCAQQYEAYLTNEESCTTMWPYHGIDCLTSNVVNCILNNGRQIDWVGQQAAAILLGFLPTLLAMTGSNTVEIGMLALRRPLLAFLIAMGAPIINPLRAFDYRHIVQQLKVETDPKVKKENEKLFKKSPELSMNGAILVTIAQYSAVCAAVVNVAFVAYDLCLKTVTIIAMSTAFLPALWIVSAVIIILVGVYAFKMRVTLTPRQNVARTPTLELKSNMEPDSLQFPKFFKEMQPFCTRTDYYITPKPETYTSIFLSWLVANAVVVHLAFGTLLLSSLLFIAPTTAAGVAFRLFASSLICRVVLMYELSGLREKAEFRWPDSEPE